MTLQQNIQEHINWRDLKANEKIRFTSHDKQTYVGYLRKSCAAGHNQLFVTAEKAEKFKSKTGKESISDKSFYPNEIFDIVRITDEEYELNKIKV